MAQPTLGVLDKDGAPQTINTINNNGRAAAADSQSVTLATEDKALLPASLGSKADAASLAVTQSTEDKAVLAAMSAKLPASLGSKADAASLAVTQSTEDKAVLAAMSAKLPASLGQKAMAASLAAVIASDQTAIPTKATGYKVGVDITRPSDTTAYAALDVVGDTGGSAIFTFAAAGPSAGFLRINNGRLFYNIAGIISGMAGWRVHLFNASPTAIADNAPFNLASGDRAKYLGFIDIGALQDLGDTLFTEVNQQNKQILLVGGATYYVILQTIGAFTPGSADTLRLELMGEDL